MMGKTTTFPVEPEVKREGILILRHSLGLDPTGRGRVYRNHYCAGPGHHSWKLLQELVAAGLMVDHGKRGEITGGDHLLHVTDRGLSIATVQDPLPKVSKGSRRYREFLSIADAYPDLTFKDFLTLPCFAEARARI